VEEKDKHAWLILMYNIVKVLMWSEQSKKDRVGESSERSVHKSGFAGRVALVLCGGK
jgi:hypothetical protein